MTNEEKAKEIANAFFIENVSAENKLVIREMLNKAALEAMKWKDKEWAERFKNAFQGLWTASFNVENLSSEAKTTIEFELVTRE